MGALTVVLHLVVHLLVVVEISQAGTFAGCGSYVLQPVLALHKLLLTLFEVHHLCPFEPCIVDEDASPSESFAAAAAKVAAVHWH